MNITVTKVRNFSPFSQGPNINNTSGIPTLQVCVSTVFLWAIGNINIKCWDASVDMLFLPSLMKIVWFRS